MPFPPIAVMEVSRITFSHETAGQASSERLGLPRLALWTPFQHEIDIISLGKRRIGVELKAVRKECG
jgi:hypothetical protein